MDVLGGSRPRTLRRAVPWLAASTVVLAAVAVVSAATGKTPPRYYVAIGASETLGYQPTSGGSQRPTDRGYANDLTALEGTRWPGLRLVRFACPGIRLELALSGGRTPGAPAPAGMTTGRCRRRRGSEVGTASAFIRSHPGQVVLVTVDLGYPDVATCLAGKTVDPPCVTDALERLRSALPAVVSRLRAAGGASLRIVGLNHEDPSLAYYLRRSDPDPAFAEASAGVTERFNRVLDAAYARVGVRVAQVGATFATGVTTPARLPGRGTVPLDVQRICTLTWMCTDGNLHPNTEGYRRIAAAVAAAVAG